MSRIGKHVKITWYEKDGLYAALKTALKEPLLQNIKITATQLTHCGTSQPPIIASHWKTMRRR